MLIHVADVKRQIADAKRQQVDVDESTVSVRWKELFDRVSASVDADSAGIARMYDKMEKLTYYPGFARFTGERELTVAGKDGNDYKVRSLSGGTRGVQSVLC